ncbi:MAG: ankyrin repeat domain-containing protein [Pseudomonadota bacterium]
MPDPDRPKECPDIVRYARLNQYHSLYHALRKNPLRVNDIDPISLMTALHWACANRSLKSVQEILEVDEVDLWVKDKFGRTAMDIALDSGNMEIIDLLFDLMHPEKDTSNDLNEPDL